MSHINFDKGSNKKKGLMGFYIALAVCLVAVGGVAVATFTSSGLKKEGAGSDNQSYSIINTTVQPVEQNVTNIPYDQATTSETKSEVTKTTKSSAAADLFILPLSNEVMHEYSNTQPVYSPTMNDWRVHNGTDFKGETNQPVKALADGTIVSIESDDMWGNTVTIDHGYGIQSHYCGVTVSSLKVKDTVKVGDTIGVLSDIPCEISDGAHLHLEITVNNEFVNPVEAIGRDVQIITTTSAQ